MTQYEKEVLKALKTIEKGISNMAKELKQATAILANVDWTAVVDNLPPLDEEEPIEPIEEGDFVTEDDLPFN